MLYSEKENGNRNLKKKILLVYESGFSFSPGGLESLSGEIPPYSIHSQTIHRCRNFPDMSQRLL
jgi:hypothetical protein